MSSPTLAEVGAACGVSASTVSRALSRPDQVNADVRDRIIATAERMGYRPNKVARGLATGQLGRIGVIVPDIVNPFFAEVVRAIQHVAGSQWQRSVLIVDSGEQAGREGELIASIADEVDGMVLASPRSEARTLRRSVANVPCVVINRALADMDAVLCDYGTGLASALDELVRLGHKHIAVVRGPSRSWAAVRKATALRARAATLGIALIDLGAYPATYEGGLAASTAAVSSGATAVFAYDDIVASGIIAGLHDSGVRVPSDVSVVGCDDTILARILTPALTTLGPSYEEVGQEAIRLLRDRADYVTGSRQIVRIECGLVLRESVAAPPRSERRRG